MSSSAWMSGGPEELAELADVRIEVYGVGCSFLDLDGFAEVLQSAKPDAGARSDMRWGIVLQDGWQPFAGRHLNGRSVAVYVDRFCEGGEINGVRVRFDGQKMKRWLRDNLAWRVPECGVPEAEDSL
jgi:hypothetical protein